MTQFIADQDHYDVVLERVQQARHMLWIGTADIKDLYIKRGNRTTPLLAMLAGLLEKGVEIRLIHAKEPGPNFRQDFDKYPILAKALERVLCNRVHFKIIVVDGECAYVGSANLTGAGMGMKSQLRGWHLHRRTTAGRRRHGGIRQGLARSGMRKVRPQGVLH